MDPTRATSEPYELISLSELIEQIKRDLMANRQSDPALYIDGIEVSAQVVATRNKTEGGNAGIGLAVLGLKADAGLDSHSTLGSQLTQTVTIKLSPLLSREEIVRQLDPDARKEVEQAIRQGLVRGNDPADSV
jgi:hypothetical protein